MNEDIFYKIKNGEYKCNSCNKGALRKIYQNKFDSSIVCKCQNLELHYNTENINSDVTICYLKIKIMNNVYDLIYYFKYDSTEVHKIIDDEVSGCEFEFDNYCFLEFPIENVINKISALLLL